MRPRSAGLRVRCVRGRSSATSRSRRRFSAHDSSHGPTPQLPATIVEATPLVGRSQELGLLRDCWKQVSEGRGRVVLLSGDAGIGKVPPGAGACFRSWSRNLTPILTSAARRITPTVRSIPSSPCFRPSLGWSRADANEARLEKLDAFCARHRLPPAEAVPLLASLLSLPASDALSAAGDEPRAPEAAELCRY